MSEELESKIIVKRTDEIDHATWQQICHGYDVCFDIKRSPEDFRNVFSQSITGYSIHALKFSNDGKLIGHNYYQPRPYILNGKRVICALSGGTFVLPEYRNDIFIFYDMVKVLNKEANRLGWIAFLGVPNENSFMYSIKINKTRHIGNLSYYILPVKVAKILKKPIIGLNLLSETYSKIVSFFNICLSSIWNNRETIRPLHIEITDTYLNLRFDNKYSRIQKGNTQGIYRIYDEDGIKTAYIVYFGENYIRTYKSLTYVVNKILKDEDVDAIMYVGTLNLPQMLLTKVPQKYDPHKLPLCVLPLDVQNKEIIKALESIDNIDFGLINFDVR